ncbi:hypothetical protein J6590_092672 [Homalodisca vitripennis]|nr:hypothetical protein J6590_092672 [Homalodisca vitripennis]
MVSSSLLILPSLKKNTVLMSGVILSRWFKEFRQPFGVSIRVLKWPLGSGEEIPGWWTSRPPGLPEPPEIRVFSRALAAHCIECSIPFPRLLQTVTDLLSRVALFHESQPVSSHSVFKNEAFSQILESTIRGYFFSFGQTPFYGQMPVSPSIRRESNVYIHKRLFHGISFREQPRVVNERLLQLIEKLHCLAWRLDSARRVQYLVGQDVRQAFGE